MIHGKNFINKKLIHKRSTKQPKNIWTEKNIYKNNNKGNYVQKDRESKNNRMESSLELNPQAWEKQTKSLQTMLTAGPILGLDFET